MTHFTRHQLLTNALALGATLETTYRLLDKDGDLIFEVCDEHRPVNEVCALMTDYEFDALAYHLRNDAGMTARGVQESFKDHWRDICRETPQLRDDLPAKGADFSEFVDNLQREGQISDLVAHEAECPANWQIWSQR